MALIYQIMVSLLTLLVGKWIIEGIWNAFFSPLSAIPGPRLTAVTRLPLLRQKASGSAEAWRVQLHRTYGDVVRVAPDEVSFANEAALRTIYGYAPGSQFAAFRKDPNFYGGQNEGDGISLISAEDLEHARQRKNFSPAFSEKAVRAQETLIKGYVKLLVRNIRAIQPIDLAKQYNFTTFDLMGALTFGHPLGCLDTSEYISWITGIFGALKVMTIFSELNRIPLAVTLLKMMIPPSLREKAKQHAQFSIDRVQKRLAEKDDKTDIWHFVLAAQEKDIRLRRSEMYANAGLFMIAGTETSATLLSALTYYLLTSPDKMEQLTHEIRGQFKTSESINAQELQSLKYLTACANETFRMHHPVPIGLPRVVPQGGANICGYRLTGGTSIYVHQLSLGRNPNNFIEPDCFLPERWLSREDGSRGDGSIGSAAILQTDARFAKDKKSCLQPFSIGPRNCLGQNLAWLEIRLIIAHVLWHFDLELCEDSRNWDTQEIFNLWVPKPLMVRAKPVVRPDGV